MRLITTRVQLRSSTVGSEDSVTTAAKCPSHEAVEARMELGERDRTELWNAVDSIRKDIKGILTRIGLLVGTITTINSVALILVQLFFNHTGK